MKEHEEIGTQPGRIFRAREQAKIEAVLESSGQRAERTKNRISRSRLVRNIAAATFCLSAIGYGVTEAVDKDTPFDEVAMVAGVLSFHVGIGAEDKRRRGIAIVNGLSESAVRLANMHSLDIPEWAVLPREAPLPPSPTEN